MGATQNRPKVELSLWRINTGLSMSCNEMPVPAVTHTPHVLNRENGTVEQRIGFLLVPGYTFIGYACAIEPLRMANMAADHARFAAYALTIDGYPVVASNGVSTAADYALADTPALDAVLICGPNPIAFPQTEQLIDWLRTQASADVTLGGIDTGSFLLAQSGLLDGCRATIHWQDSESLLCACPEVLVSNRLFEIDGNRLTSGGGTAAMDMMLAYISRWTQSDATAASAAELLVWDRVRPQRERQRYPLQQQVGTAKPKLRDAIAIMEANIDEPLSLAETARHANLSVRQLERLFRDCLDCTPGSYYLQLRLHAARSRLLYSDESITEIARDTGFMSPSYFSKRYRRFFGITPRTERRRD